MAITRHLRPRHFLYTFAVCYCAGIVFFLYTGIQLNLQSKQQILREHPVVVHRHVVSKISTINRHIKENIFNSSSSSSSIGRNHLEIKCKNNLYKDSYFHHIVGNTYIYSAYLDERPNNQDATFVRLIVLSDSTKPDLWCYFDEDADLQLFALEDYPPHKKGYYEFAENHGSLLGGYLLSCRIPSKLNVSNVCHFRISHIPRSFDFPSHSAVIPLRKILQKDIQAGAKKTFGICIPAIFGNVSWLSLVEFFEFSTMLGAEHFTMYYVSANPAANSVLRYYEHLGVLTVVPWDLKSVPSPFYKLQPKEKVNKQKYRKKVWNYAQAVNINDCLMRTALQHKYTAFNDLDEFIVPSNIDWNSNTSPWQQMVTQRYKQQQLRDNECAMCFKSLIFDISQYKDNDNHIDNLRILQSTKRDPMSSLFRRKCLSQNLRIFEHGIHHISKQIVEHFTNEKINQTIGLLYHYRSCNNTVGISCDIKHLIEDYSVVKNFGSRLKERVQQKMNILQLYVL